MDYGFVRVACISPRITVADCAANADEIIRALKKISADGVAAAVFPELCITGYTCGDLFLQKTLQRAAVDALLTVAEEASSEPVLFAVGLPIACGSSLYNCAAIIYKGEILAVVPKTYIPNYGEFYEARHFSSGAWKGIRRVRLSDRFPAVPFGSDILIADKKNPDVVFAAEICEDLWVPHPPSIRHAVCGASILLNLSASNEVIGKSAYRRMLVASQSGRLRCAYAYADAGTGESTTDLVFAAHNLIAENGSILNESELYGDGYIISDIDTQRLMYERRRTATFAANESGGEYYRVQIELPPWKRADKTASDAEYGGDKIKIATGSVRRFIDPYPFVPSGSAERQKRCREIVALQSNGLAKRLRHTGARKAVIGLSGGLDSTLALLITAEAFKLQNLSINDIVAVTMPCFGTTNRTRQNARALANALGVTLKEISIKEAVLRHFTDLGRRELVYDVTYENSQARERTQVLMDLANEIGALVVGTGDLSELALGWATYNGDHMSMYGVNASVPKTLVRYLVSWFADADANDAKKTNGALAAALYDILDTPVSPELLPPKNGCIAQKTEEIVGPYELHDFFLYYAVRWGFSPKKILFLADQAFQKNYAHSDIKKWLIVFYRRFFAQQFKRSCLPDGAKVGTVSLSPRGDWRMPSDASSFLWINDAENEEDS